MSEGLHFADSLGANPQGLTQRHFNAIIILHREYVSPASGTLRGIFHENLKEYPSTTDFDVSGDISVHRIIKTQALSLWS